MPAREEILARPERLGVWRRRRLETRDCSGAPEASYGSSEAEIPPGVVGPGDWYGTASLYGPIRRPIGFYASGSSFRLRITIDILDQSWLLFMDGRPIHEGFLQISVYSGQRANPLGVHASVIWPR